MTWQLVIIIVAGLMFILMLAGMWASDRASKREHEANMKPPATISQLFGAGDRVGQAPPEA